MDSSPSPVSDSQQESSLAFDPQGTSDDTKHMTRYSTGTEHWERKGQGMTEPSNTLWSYAPGMTKNEKVCQPLAHAEHNSARCLMQDKHLDVWLYILFFLQILGYYKH